MLFKQSTFLWGLTGLVLILGLGAIAVGPIMSLVEKPEYNVVTSKGAIEVRDYGQMIAAETEVTGERQSAITEGFRTIASYIFGANKPNTKIEMTAPVQQQREQTIAMRSPVTQQNDGGKWKVRFIMPKSWTIATLPAPTDKRVRLIQLPAKRMVALRFTWRASDSIIAKKTAELRKYVRDEKLVTVGEPLLAFYNPPWTLPFFRRNEIMLELAEKSSD